MTHVNSDRMYWMSDVNNNLTWDDGEEDRITFHGHDNGMRLMVGGSSPSYNLEVGPTDV